MVFYKILTEQGVCHVNTERPTVMGISIIQWVNHDPQLLGSLVSFDEALASISAAANYWDSVRDKRWREGELEKHE